MTNAILMASGLGTRMRPITETTPKPLVRVHNVPMIETVINCLQKVNVANIYVVVGYLSEQFKYLEQKFSNVKLIYNPDYKIANNISSIFYASDKLKMDDCFICEADLYISDASVLSPIPSSSGYYGKWVTGYSDDWVFELNECGHIKRIGKGGQDCFNMVGISFFKKKDAEIVSLAIKERYKEEHFKNYFWDEIVNENLKQLSLNIFQIKEDKIVEIDTVKELNNINNMLS